MNEEISSTIADLSQNLEEKEAEIELLQQTFNEICSELDLDRVFQIVSERARELINAKTLLIPLLDDNCETYTYRSGSGEHAEEIVGESLPVDSGVCGWVLKHRKSWQLGNLDELDNSEKNRWEKEAANLILVPLQGKRRFLGGISGLNKAGGGTFTKNDLNVLQLFASIVSIAIENAMAVESIKASNKLNVDYRIRLETLNKQLVESSRELEYLSLYDSVTALPNRSLFYDRLAREIKTAEHNERAIGLLLIDIDGFKDINDVLGHDRGDELLNKIARRFEESIGNNETLARLSSDEFIVVLPGHDETGTAQRGRNFIDSLSTAFDVDKVNIMVNASIGISTYPQHGKTISSLLSHADFAMHEAKKAGVDIRVYNPDDDHLEQDRLVMLTDIHRALDDKEFELHYQPKISTATGAVVSAEALGRWHSKTRGKVPPKIFVQVLQQSGLLNEYTYWAIDTAVAHAREWQRSVTDIRIAVNLSPQTLMHPDFVERIGQIVRDKATGSLLTFEITENLFLSEYDRLANVLKNICSLGIELSIDDFGMGYSSLSRLRRLPVSELKIDKSFVKEMANNQDDAAIVYSTIELAHNLGLTVVAEGVETQSALDLLTELGCDIVQGYVISEPLTSKQFSAYITK